MVEEVINDLFNEALEYGTKKVSFSLFGGEPTLCWNELQRAIELSSELSFKYGIECIKSIVTNGLMSLDKAEYLVDNFDNIYISFDGPKDIFMQQRVPNGGESTYEQIFKVAKYIYKNFKKLQFKVTITKNSINRIDEIMNFFNLEFPFTPQLYQPCMLDKKDEMYVDFGEFLDKYMSAYSKNPLYRFTYNSIFKKVPSNKFCNLSIRRVVYPNGRVLGCHRCNICDDNDLVLNNFTVGEYKEGKIFLNRDKLDNIIVNNIEDCAQCFAKYHCAGGCPTTKLYKGIDIDKKIDYCKAIKKYTIQYFLKEFGMLDDIDCERYKNIEMQEVLDGNICTIEEFEKYTTRKISILEVMKNGQK